jgi:Zn-dependent protease
MVMNSLNLIQKVMIWVLPILFAVTVHETAHGWVASKCGDNTAKRLGRITLNPFKHIDMVGTVIMPLICLSFGGFVFGWAKPVPINPANFKNIKRDSAIVAAAGPASNLLMALIWGAITKIGLILSLQLGPSAQFLIYTGSAGVAINCVLMILNLVPIPPLDGSRVVASLLPPDLARSYSRIEPYGFLILMLLLFSGILSFVLGPLLVDTQNMIFSIFALH